MKKAFVIAVKAVFGVAKVVLAILGVLVLVVVASLLLSIPGGKRFSRYCSYPDMKALMVALVVEDAESHAFLCEGVDLS